MCRGSHREPGAGACPAQHTHTTHVHYACTCTCTCMHMCMHMCMRACAGACVHCAHMHVRLVAAYIYMCYTYMHVHVHVHVACCMWFQPRTYGVAGAQLPMLRSTGGAVAAPEAERVAHRARGAGCAVGAAPRARVPARHPRHSGVLCAHQHTAAVVAQGQAAAPNRLSLGARYFRRAPLTVKEAHRQCSQDVARTAEC